MCGIGGIYFKNPGRSQKTGEVAYRILDSIRRRGQDSTGVALWQANEDGALFVDVNYEEPGWGPRIVEHLDTVGKVEAVADHEGYVRAAIRYSGSDRELVDGIDAIDECVTVASIGDHVEIIKNIGTVDRLEEAFHLTHYDGPVAMGIVRNATESRVDFSHAQPLSARSFRDILIMHNGHITNYHRLRWAYENKGYTFTTGNDSEICAVVIADVMAEGGSFEDALKESIVVIDGSFTYVAMTKDAIGLVKDQFGFKPMVVAENDEFMAMASDSWAIREGVQSDMDVWEPGAGAVLVWRL